MIAYLCDFHSRRVRLIYDYGFDDEWLELGVKWMYVCMWGGELLTFQRKNAIFLFVCKKEKFLRKKVIKNSKCKTIKFNCNFSPNLQQNFLNIKNNLGKLYILFFRVHYIFCSTSEAHNLCIEFFFVFHHIPCKFLSSHSARIDLK